MNENSASNLTMLAGDQRLSQSILWEMQRAYFMKNGMRAWQDDVVPHYISSNPYMAHSYAQVVLGYLRDCLAGFEDNDFEFDPEQPIYIVELGAGAGRLAHHFLHQFFDLLQQTPFADLQIKFVMTDFVPEIIEFWQKHERFAPWVEAGILDFALFDVMDLRPFTLINSNITLNPTDAHNPIILLTNYFFDSIPQDCFAIEDGELCENLLTVYSSQPEPEYTDEAIWERMRFAYEAIPTDLNYYNEEDYNLILEAYEANLPDTIFSFPNVGLDCLRFWQQYGNGRILLLSSDRGIRSANALIGQQAPIPNVHGSFSLMVNFHAISEYVALNDGLVLQAPHYQDNIQQIAYLLGDLPQDGLETQFAFSNNAIQQNPDDFFALKQIVEKQYDQLTLAQLLSFLRQSYWDASIFTDCFVALQKEIERCDPVWYPDILNMLENIWVQYLPIDQNDLLVKHISQLLQIIEFDSVAFFNS